jgi:radical SAM superfamily enzyme
MDHSESTKEEKIDDVILETPCTRCGGYWGREGCHYCQNTGYIPTPLGKKILELVTHNSSRIKKNSSCAS